MSSSGVAAGIVNHLAQNKIFQGDASNLPAEVGVSGDATLSSPGALQNVGLYGVPLAIQFAIPTAYGVPRTDGAQWLIDVADSAGNTWTPAITQSVNVTYTKNNATFIQIGQLVFAWGRFTPTSAGTANNLISVGVPVTAATSSIFCGAGSMTLAGTTYRMNVVLNTTSAFTFRRCDVTGTANMGVDPNAALANAGDLISFFVVYEAG